MMITIIFILLHIIIYYNLKYIILMSYIYLYIQLQFRKHQLIKTSVYRLYTI